MSRWSNSIGLHHSKPFKSQFENNRRTKPSALQEDGRGGQSGSFAKKSIVPQDYPFWKRPAEDQLSNQLHGICIQPVGDPPHSHRLISRVELAHQGEGQFQSSGLRSNPTLFIDRNRQSPAHNHPFQQNKKDTQNTKVEKYKFTEAKIKKNHLALENTQQLFCIFWNF